MQPKPALCLKNVCQPQERVQKGKYDFKARKTVQTRATHESSLMQNFYMFQHFGRKIWGARRINFVQANTAQYPDCIPKSAFSGPPDHAIRPAVHKEFGPCRSGREWRVTALTYYMTTLRSQFIIHLCKLTWHISRKEQWAFALGALLLCWNRQVSEEHRRRRRIDKDGTSQAWGSVTSEGKSVDVNLRRTATKKNGWTKVLSKVLPCAKVTLVQLGSVRQTLKDFSGWQPIILPLSLSLSLSLCLSLSLSLSLSLFLSLSLSLSLSLFLSLSLSLSSSFVIFFILLPFFRETKAA